MHTIKKDDEIQAFRSVLKVTASHPRNPDFKQVQQQLAVSRCINLTP
jgi:hypothetical protein